MEYSEYFLKLIQVAKQMEKLELCAADKPQLSKTEFRMLREIAAERDKGKDIISSELARRLGVTRSAISQIVAKMEARGIVERVASPVDRKIAYVRISEQAQSVFLDQFREANEMVERVVGEYGSEKMDALLAAYDEFYTALAKVRKDMVNETNKTETKDR